ncbi:MAG: alpha/beta hydrolase fold domain-containing protein [Actinomycetota bacterium]
MTPNLPGRLGTPDMELRDDPRADPRMVAAMAPFELDRFPAAPEVSSDSSTEEIHEHCVNAEAGFGMLFAAFLEGLEHPAAERHTELIKGVDGNDLPLYIHKPVDATGPVPGIVHFHGGGMVLGAAADPNYVYWRDDLASQGMVVVGVEFRNGSGKLGNHPFPAGLNDCAAALRWTHENRAALGISKLVVSGESGGGNLSLATTLKAKREGFLDEIDGVYAQCPYISNAYESGDPDLPSLVENDGYFLSGQMMGPLAHIYDPSTENARNPLAWPYFAETGELEGLPPHVISVNELDPLRDEGLAYFRKLLAAGVPTVSRTVNGTCHAGDLLFLKFMPDVYAASLGSLRDFAYSL